MLMSEIRNTKKKCKNHRSDRLSNYTEKILHYWLLLSTRLSRVGEKKISRSRLSSVVARINRFSAVTIRVSHTNAATVKSSAIYTTL